MTQAIASKGHVEHTKAAESPRGLDGSITRPIHITFMGAGSGFCPTLCRDLLMIGGADRGELRLVDIDGDRLATMHQVIENVIAQTGRSDGWTVRSSTDRRSVLAGSDYVVCCVEVSGVDCVKWDNDIPLTYGVDQCIGDTIGPGGLFKALRTVPVFLDILHDMSDLCPQAIMLNYTNPMSIMCLAAGRAMPQIPVVGLCHSVQGTSHLLAQYAGVPYEEMEWECAGINHLSWFTTLKHQGRDLYQSVLHRKFSGEVAQLIAERQGGAGQHDQRDSAAPAKFKDMVRKDMCVHFGAFITESSGHLSEYLPYYRKSAEGRKLLLPEYDGGSRYYASNWPRWRRDADAHRLRQVSGEESVKLERSWEYGSWIIEAREKNQPFRIHGNVMNSVPGGGESGKLITNLPGDGCVEVACMIDRNGIHPTRYGALPAQMAHLCASNMAMFDLAATAVIQRSKEAAIHALMLDPYTAAVCTPGQIRQMALEMFDAEAAFLPRYQ
ncbi:MAG: alpha-glucosidase/alpha-galactosidase [Phycisphaeraceae bacterium]